MNAILTAIRSLINKLAPAKTTAKLEDRVRSLVEQATAEAKASYEKADALTELSAEIAVSASRTRSHATKVNRLAGKLESVVD